MNILKSLPYYVKVQRISLLLGLETIMISSGNKSVSQIASKYLVFYFGVYIFYQCSHE